ncbi:MAG: NAD-dependent succinate-semialdehyde dehydrogenase [Longimicrobiales bacterium]
MSVLQSVNPADGTVLREFPELSDDQLEYKLSRAVTAFRHQRRAPLEERAQVLQRAAELLSAEKRELARLMTVEMGKTFASAMAEAEKCAWGCRYYAEHGAHFLAQQHVATEAAQSFIASQPIGPVLAIMPWNFPFWQVFRFAAPALMAGNVVLLKHASNVPQCALAIEDLLTRAGCNHGQFQTLLVGAPRVAALVSDSRISAVTLTGSEAAGSAVAANAGKHIKKMVLELGGSDPFIVMPSADLEAAVQSAVTARNINNGQSCIAAKRFIVHEQIADLFLSKFVPAMQAQVVGDPMDERTQLGPLATARIRDDLHAQVQATVAAGARVLTGGTPLDRPGYFYAPTVLTDIPRGSPAHGEELFGPVASVFRARDIDHAIQMANDSRFGLGSAAWTSSAREQQRFIEELEAGMVFINAMVASDPRLPFGGIKHSGFGRELGEFGIREFVNIKTVTVQRPAAPTAQTE